MSERDDKIKAVVDGVEAALGKLLAKHFPEAKTGDIDAHAMLLWSRRTHRVVEVWIEDNIGTAPPTSEGFKAHPAIQFPDWMRSFGFTDQSWGNDTCARATLEGRLADGLEIHCWVNYPVGVREHGDGFAALVQKPNGADDVIETLYEGESPLECALAIRQRIGN